MPGTILCLAALAVLCGCALAVDTTGVSLNYGYTFGSDVAGYLDISQDVCDITGAIDGGDFASAATIYAQGQNSIRSNGEVRTLKGWATSGEADEPRWGLYSNYFGNNSDWLDAFIASGLDGQAPWTTDAARGQIVKKGIQSNLLVAYMWHEVDEAAEEVEEQATDPAEGAPHVIDEAAAIYFGTTCPSGGIADVATKRATAWGRLVAAPDGSCVAATNLAAAEALSALQAAALAGNGTDYSAAALALERVIVTVFAQATLTYAAELGELVAAGSAVQGALPDTLTESAEGTAFFRTIQPLVAQVSPDDAATISSLLATPTADTETQVRAAFQATLDAYDISAEELGALNAASPCTAEVAPPALIA